MRFPLIALVAAAVGCATPAPPTPAQVSVPTPTASLPSWLPGVWTREWIERRGIRTDLFDVHYFQTPTLFGDVRIPRDRGAFAGAKSFGDLTDADLLRLSRQRGFAGYTTVTGAVATWRHEIDFQPPDGDQDLGRVERVDDSHMYEHALDSSYIESWRSISDRGERFLAVRVEHGDRLERVLLVAGDQFLYVRNRARDLPSAESLDSLIVTTKATRAQIVEYLDCEFSVGMVRGGAAPWEIQHSTLPWREGAHLDFISQLAVTDDSASVKPRRGSADRWTVPVNTFAKPELAALFDSTR